MSTTQTRYGIILNKLNRLEDSLPQSLCDPAELDGTEGDEVPLAKLSIQILKEAVKEDFKLRESIALLREEKRKAMAEAEAFLDEAETLKKEAEIHRGRATLAKSALAKIENQLLKEREKLLKTYDELNFIPPINASGGAAITTLAIKISAIRLRGIEPSYILVSESFPNLDGKKFFDGIKIVKMGEIKDSHFIIVHK